MNKGALGVVKGRVSSHNPLFSDDFNGAFDLSRSGTISPKRWTCILVIRIWLLTSGMTKARRRERDRERGRERALAAAMPHSDPKRTERRVAEFINYYRPEF